MKKILSLLIMFSIFVICINVYASVGYEFRWENTSVEVLVGDAIDNYLLLPKAKLYLNGTLKDDNPGILWGEDETDPDFIDTTTLGTYRLTYRAVSDIEEAVTVLFNVVDKTAPTITKLSNIVVPANSKSSYDKYFNIKDNYYKREELDIKYDDSLVNYSSPGTYSLNVIVLDPSGNYNSMNTEVTVKVVTPPTYKIIDDSFKISYGDTFIISRYYKATDAFGTDITSKIKYSNIDTSRIDGTINSKILSTQVIDFNLTDDYGNTIRWQQTFYICDELAPSIEFTKDRIEIAIGDVDSLDKNYFLDKIYEINDNSGIKKIDIEYANVKKAIGEYKVIYTIYDYANNESTRELTVSVICDSTPVINIKSDISIKTGSRINYYNYFTVADKYDGDITMNASVDDSNVNYNKKGVYFAYITAKNSYGRYSYQTIVVRVNESFIKNYYYIFFIPVGIIGIVVFFILKKKKNIF